MTTVDTTLPTITTNVRVGYSGHPATGNAVFEVLDPATERKLIDVADATSDDWMAALALADKAWPEWAAFATRTRSEILYDIFIAVREREEDFARTITLEMGKPIAEARGEVAYGNEYFRWFAEEAVRINGRFSQAPKGNGHIHTTYQSVGPVLAITPWNFPLAMATRKIAPALAAGCPIIVKPAAETPLTLLLLGDVISEVLQKHDAPDGVFSIIPTTDASGLSGELMADARLRKVTFTGSTPVGSILVKQSARHLQRTSMELGGNAPFVIAADADLDLVIEGAKAAKMRNGGEACIAANRFLVHEDIAKAFEQRLTTAMKGFITGHGLEEGTTLGPIITAKQRDRIAELVDEAVSQGATVKCGGKIPDTPGYFYPATVLTNVPADARIVQEEIFGPIATVTSFSDLDEAIRLANDTPFGLAAYGYSDNIHTAQRLAAELNAGMVGINRGAISDPAAPFGGIKASGFGREGGIEGIEEYLDTKYIAWQ
ncbi:NAD-dependent succinate-semialdehyde dehydrogenase [Corynebacterium cystitidis]|uniref:Succinate-semialdehyde dehydrogenase / glutarate-semialdehyde dehydrogenase n=1 Tax=Corynebacterium cystitidis DSM 20524 TaxID=1121357 RepID=A0A1H9QNL0_9CORY|nr:NAD-dependent succinate-semialdehyde dehydrogenase [Corynebacterium cystitidis]WJY81714.1 Succinate-semialdehyde dehydrogenase [NADP(+)] [Corynebacterium cystitidis DSM 20524]SER62044.1 succinate-semialdehyde dehydrogenase / glutarate-semialdehyde dehydrogenase [Corynebacterium cystitidis DSM 20524]SNV84584.1 putative succinate-semialdehyde dehydrogenase [Corynebacterium cystitidis]